MSEDAIISPSGKRNFYIEEVILVLLLAFSLVGVRITDHSPVDGYGYWMTMVFVFAMFATFIASLQANFQATALKAILREQILHWFTSLMFMEGIFLLFAHGHLSAYDAGIVLMMILAQATILDGLRIGWRFSLVGVFLGICALIAVMTVHYFWIGLLIAASIIVGTIIGQVWLQKRAQASYRES